MSEVPFGFKGRTDLKSEVYVTMVPNKAMSSWAPTLYNSEDMDPGGLELLSGETSPATQKPLR